MRACKQCWSYAINPENHGRKKGVDLDLCDVCYWRKRAHTAMDALKNMVSLAVPAMTWQDDIGQAALSEARRALEEA